MLLLVLQEHLSNLRHQRIAWVRVCEQGGDGQQHFRDRQRWAPLVLQDVQANRSVRVHVAVVDLRCEMTLWGLEGVVCREGDVQEEDTARIWGVRRAHDGSLPTEHIIAGWPSRAIGRRVVPQVCQLLLNPPKRHVGSVAKKCWD